MPNFNFSNRQLVYDLPTRIFHLSFGLLFLTAFVIGKTVDDETPAYAYHMLAGLTLGAAVFLRLVWGVIGTKHAKFSNFALNPKSLISYLLGIVKGDKTKWAGHNPASSWVAIVMMWLSFSLVFSGFNMVSGGNKEEIKEWHEMFGNIFILLVIAHVLGIFLHTIRHKEVIGLSMVDGKKSDVQNQDVIPHAHLPIGLLFLALLLGFVGYLRMNFDPVSTELNLFGKKLVLVEKEKEGEKPSANPAQEDLQKDQPTADSLAAPAESSAEDQNPSTPTTDVDSD